MKSATSTLQQQLAVLPGIFMADPKEPNFFSDDKEFARGLKWYSQLYAAAAEGDLLGEASTHYTKLPTYPDTVERLRQWVPQARFIYVMRHPVDRLISHYIHEWSMGIYRCEIGEAIERYPELVSYGQYAMQLKPYLSAFGRNAVLPVFFDRLTRQPQAELERVCRFIGYPRRPIWSSELGQRNVSSERIRRFWLYGALVESASASWLRRRFVPQSWRDAVKDRLTMRKRPILDDRVKAALEESFNPDLAELGTWLGNPLDCSNFKQVSGSVELNWTELTAEASN